MVEHRERVTDLALLDEHGGERGGWRPAGALGRLRERLGATASMSARPSRSR